MSRTSLVHFGVTSPPTTAGIVVDYQVAQKLHACTDLHSDQYPNDRVRDVVDLHLLKAAFYGDDTDLASLAQACRRLFEGRAGGSGGEGGAAKGVAGGGHRACALAGRLSQARP